MTAVRNPVRSAVVAAGLLIGSVALALAQGAPPARDAPSDIIGPDRVFRLSPDGANWSKFQTVRSIGVRCSDKVCGSDRVFCMIQTRKDDAARPGVLLPTASADTFAKGVIANAPKELKAEMIAPFGVKRFGANQGLWAEVKAEGEPGSLRFGLFLVAAKGYDVAFNCVTPMDKWAEHQPKIETLLADLRLAQ